MHQCAEHVAALCMADFVVDAVVFWFVGWFCVCFVCYCCFSFLFCFVGWLGFFFFLICFGVLLFYCFVF